MAGPFDIQRRKPAKISTSVGGGGGGGTSGMGTLLGFMLGQQQREQQATTAGQTFEGLKEQFPPGSAPPGSSVNIGKTVSANIPLNRKFTIDETRQLGMSDAFRVHIKDIGERMQTNPDQFRKSYGKATARLGSDKPGNIGLPFVGDVPFTFGDKDAQMLKFRLTDMADRILRLRSGAQINEQEFQRLRGLLPVFEDITDPSDTDFEVINTKLNTFLNEFEATRQRIINGQSYEDMGIDVNGQVIKPGQPLPYNPTLWGGQTQQGESTNPLPGVSPDANQASGFSDSQLEKYAQEAIQLEPNREREIRDDFFNRTGRELNG